MKDIDGRNVSVIIVGFFALKVAIADLKIPEPPPPPPPFSDGPQKTPGMLNFFYFMGI